MKYICYTVSTQPQGYEFGREAYHFPTLREAEGRYDHRVQEVKQEVAETSVPVLVSLYEQHTLFGTLIPINQQIIE